MNLQNNHTAAALDWKYVFRALRHRNFKLFFVGQGISLVGTWMQQIAMSWLVYRLTNSVFLLGMVGFAGQIPTFIFVPFAGVIADRYNRRRILIITQSLAMLQAAILTLLVLSGSIAVWHIITLIVFAGLVNAFDIPIRQAFIVEMIEKKEDLGNAIALNSTLFNLARLLGPAIAGILIHFVGEGVCFLLNSISYLAVLISLVAMQITATEKKEAHKHVLHDLKEGLVYVLAFKPIAYILALLSVVSLMGVSFQILMPVFAKDVFKGGPQTLGFLVGMAGVGALVGAIYLAARRGVRGLGRMISVATVLFGLGLVSFSFSQTLWVSLLCVIVAGFGLMVQMCASNTILQTIVDEDKRGRMMSFYTLAFMGMAPLGSLLAGSLASRIGAPHTLFIGGTVCVVVALIFARQVSRLKEETVSKYTGQGVLPEVANAMQTAARFEIFSQD
ncbi:MAG: MFS transporter [Candidatus Omnitrophota bacterium]